MSLVYKTNTIARRVLLYYVFLIDLGDLDLQQYWPYNGKSACNYLRFEIMNEKVFANEKGFNLFW